MSTPKRAGAAARQLLFHRQRSDWMARIIRDNESLLSAFLLENEPSMDERVPLPGGAVIWLAEEGWVSVEAVSAAPGYEQLTPQSAAA